MASTYTPLGVELQATGENAGTWGTKTNTNLQIIEQISGGFTQQSIAGGAQTTTLSVSDGSTGAVLSHRMIEFTGSITGNQIVTIPLDVQTFYILRNSTSGAYTVQFKYVSGSGDSFTFSATNKGDKVVFASANDGTNPDIISVNTGIADVVSDTSPQLGGNLDTNSHNIDIDDAHGIRDENGNEQIIFQTTSSAVNQFDVTNAATGNPPKISATGGDTNIDLDLEAKGTGHLTVRGNDNAGAIQLNCESNSHGQIIKSQPHSAGVTNEMLLPAGSSSTLVSLVSTDTLTNKTLTAPKIADAGFIADANGNEQIIFQTTSSAVNELEVTNAATGNNPAIAASGGDTNVGLEFTAKGAGYIKFNDLAYIPQQALTSSSNAVAWDVQAKPNAYHLTTENTTFSAPTNSVEGSFVCLEINYNGSHTIAFNTVFEFAASTAPTFTSTDGKTDILVFRYNGAVWQEVGRTLNLSES
jgi:hypothetical protein